MRLRRVLAALIVGAIVLAALASLAGCKGSDSGSAGGKTVNTQPKGSKAPGDAAGATGAGSPMKKGGSSGGPPGS